MIFSGGYHARCRLDYMSIIRERLSIKSCEAVNAGYIRNWLDARRRAVGEPTNISHGKTNSGNKFVLAVV